MVDFWCRFFHGLVPIFFTVYADFSRFIRDINGEKKNISLLMIFFTVSFSRFTPSRIFGWVFLLAVEIRFGFVYLGWEIGLVNLTYGCLCPEIGFAGNATLATSTAREQNRALGPEVYARYPNPGKHRTIILTIAFAGSSKSWASQWW